MKKKVLYVAQSAGGVAEYLYMLLENINKDNFEHILVVSEDYKSQIKRFENLVDQIYFVPMTREINAKSDIKAIILLKKVLKKVKPDIVYLQSSKAGAIGRIALLFNFKTKIIYNAHGWYFNADIGRKKKIAIAVIEKILALKTSKIINISKSEYDSAIKYRISNSNKMCIIQNGIDFNKFENSEKYREQTRHQYNIKDNQIVIGVVGRLTEQKDPITSIKAFKIIHEKYNNTKFMFIGSGELEKNVLEFVKQENIEESIIVTGWTSNVEKYIPALDIAILPSKWEGFGLAIIEYMACNKPIIATKVGGIKDIIKDKKSGFLFDVGNEKELANYMQKYIEDKHLVDSIIQYNYRYAKKMYNIEQVVEKHELLFNSI